MRFGIPLFLLLVPLVIAAPAAAQTGRDRWQITLGDGRILWDVRLLRLDGESLHVSRGDSLAVVSVGQVTELRLIKKSEVRPGDPAGTMAALMGTDDEVYDLTPLDFGDRIRAVQKVFLYHPPEAPDPNP